MFAKQGKVQGNTELNAKTCIRLQFMMSTFGVIQVSLRPHPFEKPRRGYLKLYSVFFLLLEP